MRRSRPGKIRSFERVIGTIRRECLDHVIVWNERSLRRTLRVDLNYYHCWRTHLALDKDAPESRPTQSPDDGPVGQHAHVGGSVPDLFGKELDKRRRFR